MIDEMKFQLRQISLEYATKAATTDLIATAQFIYDYITQDSEQVQKIEATKLLAAKALLED